ncbi:PH-domain-containing protein [Punctularia strigosozonata HHB-11173 SS5]|uniref:PH-domain-containing protein n=1 Tax=Punctularia strigosozonata (strain HHB-11173) TaxID=741275 RepID=UPI00044180CA|nr:PH-domain-containing protein [Punctularia strigosozonata HHB-11173 SS5]EIN10064.1 PH-domain-containing protein [Punctularia strigosozonata HHB-11173 SS5]
MAKPAPPPSLQEITRKLSLHSVAKPPKPPSILAASGGESDSDSIVSPDLAPPSPLVPVSAPTGILISSSSQPPLSVIAEARAGSGEESEEEDEEGGWRSEHAGPAAKRSRDDSVIKAGYLWKKGERRKTWKKRWFVLRPTQLAYYKTSAEYRLLRLLELSEVHSCTTVDLKKHAHSFGLVSPTRTFYLHADSSQEMQGWVTAINHAKENLDTTSTQNSGGSSSPINIPTRKSSGQGPTATSSTSHSPLSHAITTSDSDDAYGSAPNSYSASSPPRTSLQTSPSKHQTNHPADPGKMVLSGYLMKMGAQRRKWRKRWFVLTGEFLTYSGSHMDTKPHRQVPLSQIVDALECEMPHNRAAPHGSIPAASPPQALAGSADDGDPSGTHTFKIITTKRALLLCAPSEEEEIQWLSAVRALIARRSGANPTEGAPTATSGQGAGREKAGSEIAHGHPISGSASVATSGSGGLRAKVRRLSTSGTSGTSHHPRGVSEESSVDRHH